MSPRSRIRIGLFTAVTLAALSSCGGTAPDRELRKSAVRRGELLVTIQSSGTVEPEETVDIGAQVQGMIRELGIDKSGKTVDYGSEVAAGALLAQVDDSLYLADAQSAEARIMQAKGSLAQAKARRFIAERDWRRAERLGPSEVLSQSAYDNYRSAYEAVLADIKAAEGSLAQAEADAARAQRNLKFCTIRSPVDGVVIDRKVSVGQTVVSSFNAPSLFLLARDLKRIEVWVSVNEADIGLIEPGQDVSFTVDARPGEEFHGKVKKIRLNATMSQNVVTYVVEVEAENADGRLLPYLTANVRFDVKHLRDTLLVPNEALRWNPPQESGAKKKDSSSLSEGTVWTAAGESFEPHPVKILGTDGVVTAVESSDLSDGIELITGTAEPAQTAKKSQVTNPFAPTMPRGRNR